MRGGRLYEAEGAVYEEPCNNRIVIKGSFFIPITIPPIAITTAITTALLPLLLRRLMLSLPLLLPLLLHV